jgi:dipeptidyl aminopeptidase/acylaminoacyl peptidase
MRMSQRLFFASALAISVPSLAYAEDAAVTAARFGALESVQDIALSPDGNRIAFVAPVGAVQVIFVADMVAGGAPKPIARADPKNGYLNWCTWVTVERLACQTRFTYNDAGVLVGFSRILALNADGTKQELLTAEVNSRSIGIVQHGGVLLDWEIAGRPGSVLMTRQFVAESTIGSNIKSDEAGVGVEEVDSVTLKRRRVEQPRQDAISYLSDGHGAIRVMGTQATSGSGYLRDSIRYYYRTLESRNWKLLSSISTATDYATGFQPEAVDRGRNAVLGFAPKDGTIALYSVALDGTERREVLLSRPDVDIDSLIRIGRDNRVIGASYATERRTIEFFDPELKKLSSALGKALPGSPAIAFVDASIGEGKLLLLAASDTNPGQFYLYEKATRRLEAVLPMRNALEGVQLATMQPVTYTASDGTTVPAYLTVPVGSTGKGLPAIVMPHGGPGSRDEWGFDWLAQFFAARGYAVLQPNFRGSAGYGSAWYQKNGFKSWRVAISDVNDAGRWLLKEGIAAPGKLGIVGWSYGGYAALQSAMLDPDLFKGIVAIAPVTDLQRLREESRNFTNFPQVDAYIGQGSHVREGSPAQNAEKIKAPVLLFHGDRDTNVGVGESRLMADRLKSAGKRVEYVEFPGLDHQLADAAARTRMLREADAFLRQAFGLAP